MSSEGDAKTAEEERHERNREVAKEYIRLHPDSSEVSNLSRILKSMQTNPELKSAMEGISGGMSRSISEALAQSVPSLPPKILAPSPPSFNNVFAERAARFQEEADAMLSGMDDNNQRVWADAVIDDLEKLRLEMPPGPPAVIQEQLEILENAVQAVLQARLHPEESVVQDLSPYADALIRMTDWYLLPRRKRRGKAHSLRLVPLASDLERVLARYPSP